MDSLYFSVVDGVNFNSDTGIDTDFLLKYRPWEIGSFESRELINPEINIIYDEVNKIVNVYVGLSMFLPILHLANANISLYKIAKIQHVLQGAVLVAAPTEKGIFHATFQDVVVMPGDLLYIDVEMEEALSNRSIKIRSLAAGV